MSAFNIDQSQVETSQNITALYCATDDFSQCFGLCPNPDLAGVGVRVAFYSQSIMNAILIWLSPEDSASGAWASTILTGALVAPALRAKFKRQLTLHHATLVLNFATLSTIASAATAPMVPIWRVLRKAKGVDQAAFRQELEERARGRIILSLALGAQIVLQWIWTILMFVDPFYNQTPCSGETIIVYFAGFRTATEINQDIASWAIWLLLCFSSSLIFGVVMVFSCPSSVHESPLNYDFIEVDRSTLKGRIRYSIESWKHFVHPKGDKDLRERWLIRVFQSFAVAIVVGLIVLSELQIHVNDVLPGESEIWSFSQSAAIFLALSPIWPIAIAWLHKNETRLLPVHNSRLIRCEHSIDTRGAATYQTGSSPTSQGSPSPPDSLGRIGGRQTYHAFSVFSLDSGVGGRAHGSNIEYSAVRTRDDPSDNQNGRPEQYPTLPVLELGSPTLFDDDDDTAPSHQGSSPFGRSRPTPYPRHRPRTDQDSSGYGQRILVDGEDAENVPLNSFSPGSPPLGPQGSAGYMRGRYEDI